MKYPTRPPLAWSAVIPSGRRLSAIEGVLAGAAVGDALGLPRKNMARRAALRMFGRGPLGYRLVPGFGWCSDQTQLMLMSGQSILRSRSKSEAFARSLGKRMGWYLLSLPITASSPTVRASMKRWIGITTGVDSAGSETLVRSLMLGTVLQGTGSRGEKWIQASAELTHRNPQVVHAGILMAYAGQIAVSNDPNNLDSIDAFEQLIGCTEDPELIGLLERALGLLKQGYSVQSAARLLGWGAGVPNQCYPTAVMAIYSFLRHPTRFRHVVERAVLLGGETTALGALAGGLAGIHLGIRKIPPNWLKRLNNWPNGWSWMKRLAKRLAEWPHAVEDLHSAPALSSNWIGQLMRNAVLSMAVIFMSCLRLPWVVTEPLLSKSLNRRQTSGPRLTLGRDIG